MTKPKMTAEERLAKQREGKLKSIIEDLPELPSTTLSFLAENAEAELEARAGEASEDAQLISIKQLVPEIEKAHDTFGQFDGLSTGLELLDTVIGGLKNSEITLVAGQSNNGKSALAVNMAAYVASQVPTLFITLEMRPETLGARIKQAFPDDYQDFQLYFQKTFRLDYRTVEPLIKNAYEKGCRAVFIDYLQYLGVGMKPDEVARISRMLSELCLQYNIPFVIVVSIRKQDSKGDRKWVQLALEDIMGTSAIGYDADNVILVSRRDPEDEYDENGIWVKHLKGRTMPVHYGQGQYLRFNWDKTAVSDDHEFTESWKNMYKPSAEVKKLNTNEQQSLETKPREQMTKFELRKLGIEGTDVTEDANYHDPFTDNEQEG